MRSKWVQSVYQHTKDKIYIRCIKCINLTPINYTWQPKCEQEMAYASKSFTYQSAIDLKIEFA
jgi:hypothetical protein